MNEKIGKIKLELLKEEFIKQIKDSYTLNLSMVLLEEFENLQQENKQLKEELQKADSITQSCIFNGKEESTINFRECLNKLESYKDVIEEVRDRITIKLGRYINEKDYVIDDVALDELLQILDKAKD